MPIVNAGAAPPLDINVACAGCFLNERTHGVCPMARDAYDLEMLRIAVQAEAVVITRLTDLIQLEAVAVRKQTLALMPGATATEVFSETEKEVEYAPASSVRK